MEHQLLYLPEVTAGTGDAVTTQQAKSSGGQRCPWYDNDAAVTTTDRGSGQVLTNVTVPSPETRGQSVSRCSSAWMVTGVRCPRKQRDQWKVRAPRRIAGVARTHPGDRFGDGMWLSHIARMPPSQRGSAITDEMNAACRY